MKTRLAKCGHPVPIHSGRARIGCDACDPDYLTRRGARLNSDERPDAVVCVACGVTVLVPPKGRIPRYCGNRCWQRANRLKPRGRCGNCGSDLDRAGKKYCTTRCGEIARGQRLPGPLSLRTCALPECDERFQPKRHMQQCCCERHGKMLCNRRLRAAGRTYPGDPEKRRKNLRAKTQRRRAAIRGARQIEYFTDLEIFERDQWHCGICRRRVSKSLRYPHPRSASLDHVVPLSEDPDGHTRANVRCAHLACNIKRSNRGGGEQLALVG